MKLTKSQLKKIIKEELESIITEGGELPPPVDLREPLEPSFEQESALEHSEWQAWMAHYFTSPAEWQEFKTEWDDRKAQP